MRLPRIHAAQIMLGLSAAGLLAFSGIMIARALEPPPVRFLSLEVVNPRVQSTELLNVVAETERRSTPDCVNGVQIELRDSSGAQTRLPIPAREISGNLSSYAIVIPEGTTPARYQMLVREIFTCSNSVRQVEAPWLPIEILP